MSTTYVLIEDEPLIGSRSDENGWRGYHLRAGGSTLEQMVRDAEVIEIDRDGDEITGCSLFDHESDVMLTGLRIVVDRYNRAMGTTYTIEDLEEFFTLD